MNIGDLRSVSEEELTRFHTRSLWSRAPHYNIYLDELRRREYVRQGERMEKLTRSMNRLSLVGLGLTAVGVVVAALTYLSG